MAKATARRFGACRTLIIPALCLRGPSEEEAFIAHIHRWLNRDEWHRDLGALGNFGLPLSKMQARLRAILAGEIRDVAQRFGRENG